MQIDYCKHEWVIKQETEGVGELLSASKENPNVKLSLFIKTFITERNSLNYEFMTGEILMQSTWVQFPASTQFTMICNSIPGDSIFSSDLHKRSRHAVRHITCSCRLNNYTYKNMNLSKTSDKIIKHRLPWKKRLGF